ncbi:MAG TPA: hypothetical protein VM848_01500 [Acidimicrobiia bacterium]|nr:hypothetical protein [Acidimicrobiia bacterium]
MTGMKTAGVLAALVGLGMLIKERRNNTGLQKAIESNWKEIKKKLPDDWVEIAPKKRKEAARFIDSVHKATGQSRRRIRQTLQGLTA